MTISKILNSNKSIFKVGLFILVFVFTFILRAHNYEKTPTAAHLDEQMYAWSGLYLVETGSPVSWSTLDYPKRAEVFKGVISYKGGDPKASVTLYKPWLDEPPLFSLIVGESAHLFRAIRTDFVPSSFIRFPVIFMSTLVSLFVFLIAKEIKGYWMGILSMLLYGTVPIFVFASRTAMPESFISLCYIIEIFLLIKFFKNPKFLYISPIPILAGIAGLAKPTGYFIIFFALFLVIKKMYKGKLLDREIIKYAAYLILLTLPFLVIYYLYGNHFDPAIFARITSIQGHRPAGFGSLAWFIFTPSLDTSILRDSWYVFCLISSFYFLFRPPSKLARIIPLAFIFWIGVVMMSAGENDLLSWYRFPAFPMMAILGSWGISYIVSRANIFTSFIGIGMLLGNRMLGSNPFVKNVEPNDYRVATLVLMTPSTLNFFLNRKVMKLVSRWILIGVILVGIYLNSIYIYNAFEFTCEALTCPIVDSTFLSRIYFPVVWRFFMIKGL